MDGMTDCQMGLRLLEEQFHEIVALARAEPRRSTSQLQFVLIRETVARLLEEVDELQAQFAAVDAAAWASVSQTARRAGEQYRYAAPVLAHETGNESITDSEAHEFLRRAYDADQKGMADRYGELPNFATWTRYLRRFRQATGQQKYARRKGRLGPSRSVVRPNDIRHRDDDAEAA
jgi:hypothetical protein